MRNRLLAKAVFISFAMLGTPFALHAEENEVGKEAEEAQPKFIGLWESPEKGFLLEFLADGVINMIPPEDVAATGTWEEKEKNKQVTVKMERLEEKIDVLMEMKFDGDDKVTITVEDEPMSLVRVKGDLKEESFIGAWKSSDEDEENGTLSHYVTIMEKGGKGVSKSMEIFHKRKIYCVAESKFTWRLAGNRLIENYDAGTEDENTTFYAVEFLSPDKARLKIQGIDEEVFEENRTKDTNLPEAPKDYKKVTEDEFWEVMDEILEEE